MKLHSRAVSFAILLLRMSDWEGLLRVWGESVDIQIFYYILMYYYILIYYYIRIYTITYEYTNTY